MLRIIPIRDLKDTSKISEMCHQIDAPVFITKNGYEDMVIMSTEVYDSIIEKKHNYSYQLRSAEKINVAEPVSFSYNASSKGIYSIEEIKEKLKPIFDTFRVKSAVLFGSYAKGKATDKSDIDILVDSGLRGLKFFGLLNDVSEAFTCSVDLIDTYDLEKGSKLDKDIQKYGIKIYE